MSVADGPGGTGEVPALRFAPSPTGYLHLGHVRSALVGASWAHRLGGRLLLRIEDTDATRCRPAFARSILDDLKWLGVAWDGAVRYQSEHLETYAAAARDLETRGLAYPCFATRSEIAAAARPDLVDPDGAPLYPGICRGMSADEVARRKAAGEPWCLRLDIARACAEAARISGGVPLTFGAFDDDGTMCIVAARPSDWGDPVIVRKEGLAAAYNLAVVVDDALQGVTHVTRGLDLLRATDLHRLLQVLLGLPAPVYHHHALILDEDGRKLSKRDGAPSLRAMRAAGMTPAEVRRRAGV